MLNDSEVHKKRQIMNKLGIIFKNFHMCVSNIVGIVAFT